MKIQILLALTFVAVVSARRPGGGGGHHNGGGGISPDARACFELLIPRSEKVALKNITETCISENGLDTILATISESRRGHQRRRDPAQTLEDNGYVDEALTLRTCVATALGFVAEDGSFDEEAFRASLQAKAAGSSYEENVAQGLAACPTTELADFKLRDFFTCVLFYCATGAAPA